MIDYHLRKWGDPILRQKCRQVEDISELGGLILSMRSIMSDHSGLGLAAPQIGDDRQILIAKISGDPQVFINPTITKAKGYIPFIEGCLSLPGLIIPTLRRSSIEVEYQTIGGTKKSGTYTGLNAIVLQHEIDHLNGKLMYQYFK